MILMLPSVEKHTRTTVFYLGRSVRKSESQFRFYEHVLSMYDVVVICVDCLKRVSR